jgi:hypothetical protein
VCSCEDDEDGKYGRKISRLLNKEKTTTTTIAIAMTAIDV